MTIPPDWLSELSETVAQSIGGVDLPAPLGCHFFHNELADQWEISLFPGATETVGGRMDGKITPSPFTLDLLQLTWALDTIERYHWQSHALGPEDDLGPHVSLEGVYQGNRVWVRILAEAPPQFGISRRIHTPGQEIEELW